MIWYFIHTPRPKCTKINAMALAKIGLNISNAKTKILRANTPSNAMLNMEGKEIEVVENFTFLVV